MNDRFKNAFTIMAVAAFIPFSIVPTLAQPIGDEFSAPVPRFDDGRVNLGPPPGSVGMWNARSGRLVANPNNYEARFRGPDSGPVHINDIPIQPWAHALTDFRQGISLASEPYTRCKVAAGPRQIMSPYGFEIVNMPDLQRVYIFTVSNAMSYRIIYTDGRDHPENVRPSYFGHSIGQWEGDTLVVDTVGFNERSWMSRDALPHTEQMHMIERITRVSQDTMDYEVTFDDPGAYTAPWTSAFVLGWTEGEEIYEYICQENNISPAAMIGEGGESRIVP